MHNVLQCFFNEILVPDKPEYLTIKDAAKILGVNPATLRRWGQYRGQCMEVKNQAIPE